MKECEKKNNSLDTGILSMTKKIKKQSSNSDSNYDNDLQYDSST